MIVILIGPPGSGKGTQASILSKLLNIYHLSTGEALRLAASLDTQDALELRNIMKSGGLVESTIVNKFVTEAIEFHQGNCLLDGYPRNLEQANFLHKNSNFQISKVFYFSLNHESIIQRLVGRFNCSRCGKIYNKYFNLPKNHDFCDICGSMEFSTRPDDVEEIVKNRLKAYDLETAPVIDFYKEMNLLDMIDANLDIKVITEVILSKIKSS